MAGLWLAKWPNGDIVLARADDHDEMLGILDEQEDPGQALIEVGVGSVRDTRTCGPNHFPTSMLKNCTRCC